MLRLVPVPRTCYTGKNGESNAKFSCFFYLFRMYACFSVKLKGMPHRKEMNRMLSERTGKNILFILNPNAGKQHIGRKSDELVTLFEESGCRVDARTTTRPGDAAELAEQLASAYDLVVCCGGDGTLHEVVNGMLRASAQVPLGYLPTGTTNDMARTLRLPGDVRKAAGVVLQGHTAAQDLGLFNGTQYFSYIASFGAFTSIPYSTPQWLKNLLGYPAYLLQVLRCLPEMHPYALEMETNDGLHAKGRFLFGSVSNARSVSGIFRFKPEDVSLDDGLFELMLIRHPENPLEFFRIAHNLIRRKADDHFVIFRHVRTVSFRFETETSWTVDGEYGGTTRSVEIRTLHRALPFISGRPQRIRARRSRFSHSRSPHLTP